MKITGVTFHKVNIPLLAPTLWIGGVNRAWTRTIVRMQTDEGLEGLAETSGGDATLGQLQALKEHFIGQDPFDRQKILNQFWYVPTYEGMSGKYAIQALETACWDLMGKALDRPLHQLIGGAVRQEIPTIAYVFFEPDADGGIGIARPEQVVEAAAELVARHGLATIKLKGGVYEPEREVATVRALRDAFPDHLLRFDPNALWSVETTVRMARPLEDAGLEWLEDPCWGVEGMSRARRDVRIPFATNMCCVQLDQLPTAIRAGAIDIQLLDVHDWGGLTWTLKGAAVCEAFQLGVGLHSSGEAGISTALYLHLAAALPTLPHAIDSLYHHQSDDVITEPHRYLDGCFAVPEGPGLGVELDLEKLRHLESVNAAEGDTLSYTDFDRSNALRMPGMH